MLDLCALHPGTLDPGMALAYKNQTEAKKHIISCLQTQLFCPKPRTEACPAWYTRIGAWATAENYVNEYPSLVGGNKNNPLKSVWAPGLPDMATGYPCRKFDNTYKENADYARDICKIMRTPRMALTHLQNNEYNLFSTQNELCLAACLNAVIFVFSLTYCVHLLRDYFKSAKGDKFPCEKNGAARLFLFVPAVTAAIVIAASLSMMTRSEAEKSAADKTALMPTGSIIITVISGGLAVVLVACAPVYSGLFVPTDKSKTDEPEARPNAGIFTNTSTARYYRFIGSRNDLLIAYCNFLTFPILVLMIYVRYNWYSIDTHVQRAFFSAVAVGVLDITEVSVMGALYLVTEFEEFGARKTSVGSRNSDLTNPESIFFRHSNLVNVAAQLVFFLSKMAAFIPTISLIRQELAWLHGMGGTEQFRGQKLGEQPLVAVMVASFALNHVVALVGSIFSNLGWSPFQVFRGVPVVCPCGDWGEWGNFNFRLVMFAIVNLSVVCVVNFTVQ